MGFLEDLSWNVTAKESLTNKEKLMRGMTNVRLGTSIGQIGFGVIKDVPFFKNDKVKGAFANTGHMITEGATIILDNLLFRGLVWDNDL